MMTTTQTADLHILGVTDEQTECDRCGKVELRCTVILADADGVEAGRYGTSCAAKVLGWASLTAAVARRRESDRRATVDADLLAAETLTDPRAIAWIVRQVERLCHRPDELARVAALRVKVRALAEARQAALRTAKAVA